MQQMKFSLTRKYYAALLKIEHNSSLDRVYAKHSNVLGSYSKDNMWKSITIDAKQLKLTANFWITACMILNSKDDDITYFEHGSCFMISL